MKNKKNQYIHFEHILKSFNPVKSDNCPATNAVKSKKAEGMKAESGRGESLAINSIGASAMD